MFVRSVGFAYGNHVEYPRTVRCKTKCAFATVEAITAVPLILTLNSVLTTSKRASGRFIKHHRLNIDRVRARWRRRYPAGRSANRVRGGGGRPAVVRRQRREFFLGPTCATTRRRTVQHENRVTNKTIIVIVMLKKFFFRVQFSNARRF